MINDVCGKYNPSFKAVVPIKIVYNNDEKQPEMKQLAMDGVYISEKEKFEEAEKQRKLNKRVIQLLVNILLKNEKGNLAYDANNNMIRKLFASYDKDYKLPYNPVETTDNDIVKPLYKNDGFDDEYDYFLTGPDAEKAHALGKDIGRSWREYRDYENDTTRDREEPFEVRDSKKSYGRKINRSIFVPGNRLTRKDGKKLTLYVYAQTTPRYDKVPGITIKAIDFKPEGTGNKVFA